MKLSWKHNILFLFFILCANLLPFYAQQIPEPMYPYRLVNDFSGIFSEPQRDALEQKLRAYNDSTSTQIYVVTLNDLKGYPASDYAIRLGEKWSIGQKDKDNGAVILIKPKQGNKRGDAFISVGYGLEARLNDAYIGRIVRKKMIPYFRENDYFGGVNAAVDTMIKRLSGEYNADEEGDDSGISFWTVLFILLLIILFLRLFSRNGGDQNIDSEGHSRTDNGPVFFPPVFGSRSSSGGFSGGFGGGGGGSFGGGGAGGSW